MKALSIALNSIRRLFRDRTNIFFVLLMPLLLILVLGAAFGGSQEPRIGLAVLGGDGVLSHDLAAQLRSLDGIEIIEFAERDELVLAVERGRLAAGVIIPAEYDESLTSGKKVAVDFVARPDASASALENTVKTGVTEQGALIKAATFASQQNGMPFEAALQKARAIAKQTNGLEVEQETVGEPFAFDQLGQFDLGAYSQLLLFIFITSTTGSTALIQSRQLGVSRRMMATPTSVGTILLGELLGRYAVALLQGLIIMLGTALLFGMDWGDPVGAVAVFLLFALVGAGVGVLMGATFKNDQQAGAVGVVLGIGMGALGGAMVPLTIVKIFAPVMYKIAHITPHAWGIEAFEQLIIYDKGVGDILPQLGVLAVYAAVLIGLGVWRLRVALTRE